MRKVAAAVVLLAGTALVTPGCTGTILRESAGVALGAKGTFLPIRPMTTEAEARPLGQYRRFELGTMADDIGGKVPAELLQYLPAAFEKELANKKLPNEPGGKALVLRGRIIHYEDASTLGFMLGPLEEVVVRTEMVDQDSGNVLAVANCVGRTKERVNAGVKKKAEGLAKALVAWLDARYPKEAR
jgi:hypothetical protein